MSLRKNINFDIVIHDSLMDLNKKDKDLMSQAVMAREKAYAPYSKFNVGAAILLETGEIVTGNNQENACYPVGLCAERVALFYTGANYPGATILAIAISATSAIQETTSPAAPCGSCRQAISEYEFKQEAPIKILMMAKTGNVVECESLSHLLPLGFNSTFLK